MSKRKKGLFFLAAVGILLVLFFFIRVFMYPKEGEKTEYSEFHKLVQQGKIEKVVLSEKEIYYTMTEGAGEGFTDNPQKDSFKEELLLAGVRVESKENIWDIIYWAFDIFVTFLCIGVILFAVVKLVKPREFYPVRSKGKGWESVVGMEDIKVEMLQLIDVMKNKKEYGENGIRQPGGVLLEGPPGNGKTLFARALAKEADINFIPARATDFQSMFMSIGPSKVKKLFRTAKKHQPCVIFIDEFDGIGTRRNYNGGGIETENTRIVTALLNEMDGFRKKEQIVVIAATNNIRALDAALIRPGRFDKHFRVEPPGYETRKELIKMYGYNREKEKSVPIDREVSVDDLAKWSEGWSCAKIESVLNEAALAAKRQGKDVISKDVLEKYFDVIF